MAIDPNTGQEQSAQSLLDLMQPGAGQADPYAGQTLAQILQGGNPFNDIANPDFAAQTAAWSNAPATNENVSAGIARGGRYQPEFAKTLQSSGAEGGFFSIPGTEAATQIPWGYYDDPRKENPAPGLTAMSTNNWRLLPKNYQDPKYAMRAGHIIDRYGAQNLGAYLGYAPMQESVSRQTHSLGPGGHGYPLSYGYPFGPRASFFPGQLEPWTPEGGGGGMGSGVT